MPVGDRYWIQYKDVEGDHSYDDVARRLQLATESVQRRIPVNPSARVVRWVQELARLAKADKRSVLEQMIPTLAEGRWDHPYRDAFRALVDTRMFVEIVENLLPDLKDQDLHDLISGNFNPGRDHPSSRARDREYELFIAAVCRRAGMAVQLREPDISVVLNNSLYSIAAKRITSSKQVEKNVSKAATQIEAAGRAGFIFLDVTRMLDPHSVIVTHWRTVNQTVGGRLLALKTEHSRSLKRHRNGLVRGIVLHVVFPHISRGFRFGTFEIWWAVIPEGTDGRQLNQFLDRLLDGLRGT